jgi:hypothetical protein
MQRFKHFPQLVSKRNLNKKALSKITIYLLIFSFFVAYATYFFQHVQFIFAATPIVFSQNESTPASPTTFSSTQNKSFSIVITPTNTPVDPNGIIFQLGRNITKTYTNYTRCQNAGQVNCTWNNSVGVFQIIFTYSVFDQAGESNFTWFANDTSNIWNKTETVQYTLNNGTPTLLLGLNVTSPIPYGIGIRATGSDCTMTGAEDVTCTLYRGNSTTTNSSAPTTAGTLIDELKPNVGTIAYNFSSTTGVNWTSASASNITLVIYESGEVIITIDLNTSKFWWNDSVYASGLAAYTNGTAYTGDTFFFSINGVTQCSGTTNSSGGWDCTFRAPTEIGSHEARISLVAASTSNTTTLRVRPNYGPTPTGTSDRTVYENPFFIQDMNGKLKMVMVRITTWKR